MAAIYYHYFKVQDDAGKVGKLGFKLLTQDIDSSYKCPVQTRVQTNTIEVLAFSDPNYAL